MDIFNILSLVISGVALIISIVSWRLSHKATLKQMKASVYSAIMGRLFEINKLEIEKPSLFQSLYKEFNLEALEKGGNGFSHYLFMIFNLYEEAYLQHNKFDLFENEEMILWENRLQNDFIQRPFLKGYWRHEQARYFGERSKEFAKYVDEILKKAEQYENKI